MNTQRNPRILKTNAPSRDHRKEYNAWRGMISRCYDQSNPSYARYGGRGISVCDRWRNSFEDFHLDMGDCPPDKTSLGRIENDLNYLKSNCRWESPSQQNRNRRYTRRARPTGFCTTYLATYEGMWIYSRRGY